MPVLIPHPTTLTMKNCPNWVRIGLERESGYVQYRFQIKLLNTAAVNEQVLARIIGSPTTTCSR